MSQQGKLAKELDFVGHHIRTKLDELKRQEVNRLRTLIKAKQDLEGGNGTPGGSMFAMYSKVLRCLVMNLFIKVDLPHLCVFSVATSSV